MCEKADTNDKLPFDSRRNVEPVTSLDVDDVQEKHLLKLPVPVDNKRFKPLDSITKDSMTAGSIVGGVVVSVIAAGLFSLLTSYHSDVKIISTLIIILIGCSLSVAVGYFLPKLAAKKRQAYVAELVTPVKSALEEEGFEISIENAELLLSSNSIHKAQLSKDDQLFTTTEVRSSANGEILEVVVEMDDLSSYRKIRSLKASNNAEAALDEWKQEMGDGFLNLTVEEAFLAGARWEER